MNQKAAIQILESSYKPSTSTVWATKTKARKRGPGVLFYATRVQVPPETTLGQGSSSTL